MSIRIPLVALAVAVVLGGCVSTKREDLVACASMAADGLRPVASERTGRFLGKVQEDTARCRGGDKAVAHRNLPWVDWANYWATGDGTSLAKSFGDDIGHLRANGRGIDGTLLDLEYQRIELIKFNLFDNTGTYPDYVRGRPGVDGAAIKVWDAMRLPPAHPDYAKVGGDAAQICQGDLIRWRTLSGICNDLRNPLMGSSGTPFARCLSRLVISIAGRPAGIWTMTSRKRLSIMRSRETTST